MEKQILSEGYSGYISREELETLLRRTFGIRDFGVKVCLAGKVMSITAEANVCVL